MRMDTTVTDNYMFYVLLWKDTYSLKTDFPKNITIEYGDLWSRFFADTTLLRLAIAAYQLGQEPFRAVLDVICVEPAVANMGGSRSINRARCCTGAVPCAMFLQRIQAGRGVSCLIRSPASIRSRWIAVVTAEPLRFTAYRKHAPSRSPLGAARTCRVTPAKRAPLRAG